MQQLVGCSIFMYTVLKGNATIEKQYDHSVTNIRIGSRLAGRAGDQGIDTHFRPEGSSCASKCRMNGWCV